MTASDAKPLKLTDAGQIDLDSHAVIEASAGTGKTHTIERLVVRLLLSGKITSLDQVLVVTFTEKATGEIRSRIRALLHSSKSSAPPEQARTLGDALDSFDSASIFTIHGFCNRVLQLYPFEYGGHFRFDLIDDITVYEAALREIIRTRWRPAFGGLLEGILGISGFPGENRGKSGWMARVLKAAGSYCPEAGDALVPAPDANFARTIESLPARCAGVLDELDRAAGSIDASDYWSSDIAVKYDSLNFNHSRRDTLIGRILIPLVRLIALHREGRADAFALLGLRNELGPGDGRLDKLMSSWNKSGPDYEEKFPELPRIVELGTTLLGLIPENMDLQLTMNSVMHVIEEASRRKRDRALVSYRDMIALVEDAVRDPEGPLCRELRKKYRYAIVDEFQDTDMLQWSLFKNVFVAGGASRLIVVGDPKQAIYGFRGADVYAYHEAKKEMVDSGARFYSLVNNWRSSRELVAQYNLVFGAGNWFTDPDVAYNDVAYPPGRNESESPWHTGLSVVDLGIRSGSEARSAYARFIAGEIARLLSAPGTAPGDIAVLIRKWDESPYIEDELRRLGIRFSYYKKEGLYQSREAYQVRCMLAAIEDPGDTVSMKRALLTPFFGLAADDLAAYDASGHPAAALATSWSAMAAACRWPELFDSLLRDSGLAARVIDSNDGERSLADLRHIIEEISARACSGRTNMRELIKHLDGLISGGVREGDASNCHRPEREDPGVQIMTVHASKGLQFPVVFVAGGFTQPGTGNIMVYHDQSVRCVNLRADDSEAERLYKQEIRWEEERLFYVALTRAARCLYVPVFRYKRVTGPILKWISGALECCRGKEGVRWINCANDLPAPGNPAEAPSGQTSGDAALARCATALLECGFPSFAGRRLTVDSFTAIKARTGEGARGAEAAAGFGPAAAREHDEAEMTGPVSVTQDDALPGGTAIGLVFHEVLEQADYSAVAAAKDPGLLARDAAFMNLVMRALDRNLDARMRGNAASIAPEVARVVWNTLNADVSGGGLVLGRLSGRAHEVEFHVPMREGGEREGFVTGFIDMLFEHEGKYFLLDWKSNRLPAGYGPVELAASMEEARYVLQYRIYAAALLRLLRQRLDAFDYGRHFGGIYYIYLRGVDPSRPGSGIFFYRPTGEAEIVGYEREFLSPQREA